MLAHIASLGNCEILIENLYFYSTKAKYTCKANFGMLPQLYFSRYTQEILPVSQNYEVIRFFPFLPLYVVLLKWKNDTQTIVISNHLLGQSLNATVEMLDGLLF